MKRSLGLACLLLCALLGPQSPASAKKNAPLAGAGPKITGSAGCRSCHEKFYSLWATSFHGLAMRPYSDAFAKASLAAQAGDIAIGQAGYRAQIGPGQGFVVEREGGAEKKYPIAYVLGGKNVFYFLTPLDKGRLQTLPLAYDVRKREWFDTAGSGMRHFPGDSSRGVNWKEWPYTFNTACYGCHVSQLSTNYDPKTETYRTTWVEPGINCETCHDPGGAHVAACQAAPKGRPPKDLKIIRGGRDFSPAQNNDLCATCHAKAVPLTASFKPGGRFFDHFDLIGLESPDFHPDGRDLGENYTYTSWSRSPCVRSGRLDCLHCHTSSGRYKFTDQARANEACLPCHAGRVADAPAHTRHPADSAGNRCVSCHMPMTEFARMRRSDHSMLPPTPAATLAFKSPNACSGCHADKDAAWADQNVRAWHGRDYQAPVLFRAGLIDAARSGKWERLPEMVEYLSNGHDEDKPDDIVAASLIRLLRRCPDPGKWEAILAAVKSPSPLARAAAMEALADPPSREALATLAAGASDDAKLVRVRAAASLAGLSGGTLRLAEADGRAVAEATREYLDALSARPDLWTSQYNLGNYHLATGEPGQAAACFEQAARLDPASVPPLVNASIAYSRLGQQAKAAAALQAALRLDPEDGPANFNMGLLQAERGDAAGAEGSLRAALKREPGMAEAAYNLGVLLAPSRPAEAVASLRRAAASRPDQPRYAYTLAFFLSRAGDRQEATQVLAGLLERYPGHQDAARLLAEIRAYGP
jgi:tetratricopeptide (TPR) repeat protein